MEKFKIINRYEYQNMVIDLSFNDLNLIKVDFLFLIIFLYIKVRRTYFGNS